MDELSTFTFGANPSPIDYRHINYAEIKGDMAAAIPAKHKKYYPWTHIDQEKVGICTAAAVCTVARKYFNDPKWIPDEEWLYKMGKILLDKNTTEGSSLWTMLHCAYKYGIPTKGKWPQSPRQNYMEFMQNVHIPKEMLDDAALHKIPGYAQVPINPSTLMNAVYSSVGGIVTRMAVGEEWYTDKNGYITWDKNKLQPLRTPNPATGGHAIAQTGFDTTDLYSYINIDRNSWGDDWCDNGDIWFYLKDHTSDLTEAWTFIGAPQKFQFTKDLKLGMNDPDVVRLQQFLNTHGFPVAVNGPGSLGFETDYFGPMTKQALSRFQTANNINPPAGYFGPITRAFINAL